MGRRAQKFSILWIELYIFVLESDTSFIPTTASKIDKMSANKELEALIQRLESVATRLENTQGGGAAVEELIKDASLLKKAATQNLAISGGNMTALRNAISKLEITASQNNPVGTSESSGNYDGEVAPFVGAFDDILTGPFKNFWLLLPNQRNLQTKIFNHFCFHYPIKFLKFRTFEKRIEDQSISIICRLFLKAFQH